MKPNQIEVKNRIHRPISICHWNKWLDIKEDRIIPLNKSMFTDMLNEHTNINNCPIFLYKKIYKPSFDIGVFFKSKKSVLVSESEYLTINTDFFLSESESWKTFPMRTESLVCYNYLEDVDEHIGETFIVFPFKNSLFTIAPEREYNYTEYQEIDKYKKGYWSDKIKWLDGLTEREMWTDSPCIIIKKSLWDKEFNI